MRLVIGIKTDDDTTKHLQECGKEIQCCLKTENLNLKSVLLSDQDYLKNCK